jgi:hypothetical protein
LHGALAIADQDFKAVQFHRRSIPPCDKACI